VFRFTSIPGVRGRPLLGPSPALIIVSVSTPPRMPPLRFLWKVLRLSRRVRLNIHFAPFDFYKSYLTIRLIEKICENVENNYDILKVYIMIKYFIVK
jgi:hypothetical protein